MIWKMTERFYIFCGKFNPNWKRQWNIEMITKETESNIFCGDIWNRNWKRQFSIELITKITQAYILSWDISNSNWKKNSLVLKLFQRWQNLTPIVRTFVFEFIMSESWRFSATFWEILLTSSDKVWSEMWKFRPKGDCRSGPSGPLLPEKSLTFYMLNIKRSTALTYQNFVLIEIVLLLCSLKVPSKMTLLIWCIWPWKIWP